jgi:hypothetical protein
MTIQPKSYNQMVKMILIIDVNNTQLQVIH